MTFIYQIAPADTYNPNGIDGRGRNRLRIEPMTPQPRCVLKPRTYEAAWTVQNRPQSVWDAWSHFDYCSHSDCDTCPVDEWQRIPLIGGIAVIREDELGRPWLLNRADKGWSEFGVPFDSWGELLRVYGLTLGPRASDHHGPYFQTCT